MYKGLLSSSGLGRPLGAGAWGLGPGRPASQLPPVPPLPWCQDGRGGVAATGQQPQRGPFCQGRPACQPRNGALTGSAWGPGPSPHRGRVPSPRLSPPWPGGCSLVGRLGSVAIFCLFSGPYLAAVCRPGARGSLAVPGPHPSTRCPGPAQPGGPGLLPTEGHSPLPAHHPGWLKGRSHGQSSARKQAVGRSAPQQPRPVRVSRTASSREPPLTTLSHSSFRPRAPGVGHWGRTG